MRDKGSAPYTPGAASVWEGGEGDGFEQPHPKTLRHLLPSEDLHSHPPAPTGTLTSHPLSPQSIGQARSCHANCPH